MFDIENVKKEQLVQEIINLGNIAKKSNQFKALVLDACKKSMLSHQRHEMTDQMWTDLLEYIIKIGGNIETDTNFSVYSSSGDGVINNIHIKSNNAQKSEISSNDFSAQTLEVYIKSRKDLERTKMQQPNNKPMNKKTTSPSKASWLHTNSFIEDFKKIQIENIDQPSTKTKILNERPNFVKTTQNKKLTNYSV
ncbi:MAG: hypothetical protein SFT68_02440 [Rickettsiaceae bacterium]|nr:hypothetical protein [Rickettsiaceae bacterium]